MTKPTTLQFGKLTIEKLEGSKFRLTINRSKAEVDFKDLWKAIFLFSPAEQQATLMPAMADERMVFSRKHQIKATKDIKAGEMVTVWCEVNVRDTVVNAIAEENGAKVIIKAAEELSTDIPSLRSDEVGV